MRENLKSSIENARMYCSTRGSIAASRGEAPSAAILPQVLQYMQAFSMLDFKFSRIYIDFFY